VDRDDLCLNLGVSVAAVVLARPAVFRSWVPWVVATLDAGVVLGVMIVGVFAERVSASYTPALAVSWAILLLRTPGGCDAFAAK